MPCSGRTSVVEDVSLKQSHSIHIKLNRLWSRLLKLHWPGAVALFYVVLLTALGKRDHSWWRFGTVRRPSLACEHNGTIECLDLSVRILVQLALQNEISTALPAFTHLIYPPPPFYLFCFTAQPSAVFILLEQNWGPSLQRWAAATSTCSQAKQ